MFVASVTTNTSQRINEPLVHPPASVTFILSQLACLAQSSFLLVFKPAFGIVPSPLADKFSNGLTI